MSTALRLRERFFCIDPAEASFARRGFVASTVTRQLCLEQAGGKFIAGYNAAIRIAEPVPLSESLEAVANEHRGFAFEGAAMGFALLDLLGIWRSVRFARFLEGAAGPHVYMAYIGAGWALARTSPLLAWRLGKLDPLLRWLMFDGYGFHAGYFHPRDAIERQRRPAALRGYERNVFDQGLGRALWFAKCADITTIADTVSGFSEDRRADLWSGVGLAAAYAGGVNTEDLRVLAAVAESYRAHLAQGAAFAAKARARAGNPASQTELACQVFCGMGAPEAAAITDQALPALSSDDRGEAYRAWRADIGRRIALGTVGVGS